MHAQLPVSHKCRSKQARESVICAFNQQSHDTSHDCDWHVIKRDNSLTNETVLGRDLYVIVGIRAFATRAGPASHSLAIYRCRNTRPGWDGIPCGRKVRLHGAGVSETCNTFRCIPACSKHAGMGRWEGARRGGDGHAAGRLASSCGRAMRTLYGVGSLEKRTSR